MMAMRARQREVQLEGSVKGAVAGGASPMKAAAEHCSMEKISSSLAGARAQVVSKACAKAPATSAVPTSSGSPGWTSVGVLCDAPKPARSPEYAAVKTALLLGV